MINLDDIGAAAFIAARLPDGDFAYERVNLAAERFTGMSVTNLVGRRIHDVFPKELADILASNYAECLERGETFECERVVALPRGEIATRTTLTPIFDEPDQPARHMLGVTVDITQQHRLEEDLRRANARLAIAMEALGGANWYYDIKRNDFELSPAFAKIIGFNTPLKMTLEEWFGRIHPDDREYDCFDNILEGRAVKDTADFRVFSETAEIRWLRCRHQAVCEGNRLVGIAGVIIDITQDRRREDALSLQATTDPLTGLANRRRFDEMLASERQRCLDQGRPLSLLMVDVDHFKLYNDSYGHVAGDAILRRLARCMSHTATSRGGIAARYGGEEFAMILPDHDTVAAAEVADAFLTCVSALDEPHLRSPRGRVSASIGVAGPVEAGDEVQVDLVALADAALYRAKNDGRACYRVMAAPRAWPLQPVLSSSAA